MKIVHRYTQATLFEDDSGTIKKTLQNALVAKADLGGADLRGADLREAGAERLSEVQR